MVKGADYAKNEVQRIERLLSKVKKTHYYVFTLLLSEGKNGIKKKTTYFHHFIVLSYFNYFSK